MPQPRRPRAEQALPNEGPSEETVNATPKAASPGASKPRAASTSAKPKPRAASAKPAAERRCREAGGQETGCQETRGHETGCRETGYREARQAKGRSCQAGRPAEAEGRDRQAGSLAEAKGIGWHAVTIETKSRAAKPAAAKPVAPKAAAKPVAQRKPRAAAAEDSRPAKAEGRCHARNGRAEGSRQTGSSNANSARSAALVRARAGSVGRLPPRPRGPARHRRSPRAAVPCRRAGNLRRVHRRRRLLRPVRVPDHGPAGP